MPRSFRALTYVKTYSTNVLNMGTASPVVTYELAAGNHPRQLKNIRGELQFTSGDVTPNATDAAAGWVALLRWPSSEDLQGADIDLQDSRMLHPVVWNFRHYPGHVHYEFKGINLSESDSLHLVVHKGLSSGSDNIYIDFVLLWAQLNHPAVAP